MRTHRTSGTIAKDRLEHMLISDKMHVDPEVLAQMKREMRSLLRKYINAEHMRLDVQVRLINVTEQGEENVKTIQIKGL